MLTALLDALLDALRFTRAFFFLCGGRKFLMEAKRIDEASERTPEPAKVRVLLLYAMLCCFTRGFTVLLIYCFTRRYTALRDACT